MEQKIKRYNVKKCDNCEEKTLKTDVTVIQKPVKVTFDCPHCDEEIEIDYSEFEDMVGEPCDWNYSKFDCPKCGKEIEIDGADWD